MDPQAPAGSLLSPPDLSPLEQEVLEEYERLAENMKKVGRQASKQAFSFPFFPNIAVPRLLALITYLSVMLTWDKKITARFDLRHNGQ